MKVAPLPDGLNETGYSPPDLASIEDSDGADGDVT